MMRRLCVYFAVVLLCLTSLCVSADEASAVYSDAKAFVFAPGSEYSPTDMFPNFKDVMPGDSLTQPITVRNDASKEVKVEIYMRSLGASKELGDYEASVDFLSKLHLRVEKSADNEMGYMFDAAAHETAQLTDWVLLGTLYSGGEVNLNVILDVPVELDNTFKNYVGYLDWEFAVVELPIEDTDPKPPQTGDDFHPVWWMLLAGVSVIAILILLFWRKKDKEEEETATT